jgi:hypothetical protein
MEEGNEDMLVNEFTESVRNRARWFTPVILATQETEIRRIVFQSQPRQIVLETPSQKNPSHKRAGRVV